MTKHFIYIHGRIPNHFFLAFVRDPNVIPVYNCLHWVYILPFSSSGVPEEICQLETFKAECSEDHVIVMESAHYGRMMLGRCLTRNYYVGCQADVLPHMDARCSGRPQCHLRIPDPVLFDAQPCPKDLVAYLEASYRCQKGKNRSSKYKWYAVVESWCKTR